MSIDPSAAGDVTTMISRVDEAMQTMRQDPSAASEVLDDVIADADAIGAGDVAARARYALARAKVTLGAPEAALELIERSAQGWLDLGELDEAIRTNLGRMHVLDELGRHAEAVEVGRRALAVLEGRPESDELTWLRAAVEENLGVASGYLGRHAEALAAYAVASACYERLGLEADAARALANRGVELNELGRPSEAVSALQRAKEHFAILGDTLWCALCDINTSEAWVSAGRYLDAFNCLDEADASLDGLEHTTQWWRAQLARAQGLESLRLDVEALDLFDALVEPLRSAGLVDDLGKAHLGRGAVLARSKHHRDEARAAFRAAFEAFEASGEPALLARTCLAASEMSDEPMVLIDRAIALLADGERPAELAAAHLESARHLEVRDPARASEALAAASALIAPLGLPTLRGELAHLGGREAWRLGRLREARSSFEMAIRIFDDVRRTIDWDGVRPHLDAARRHAADDLIELLLESGDVETAFAVGEWMRSRNLAERMRHRAARRAPAPMDDLIATYDRLLTARGPLVDELAQRARQLERDARGRLAPVAPETWAPPPLVANHLSLQTIDGRVIAFVTDDAGAVTAHELTSLDVIEADLRRLEAHWRRFEHAEVASRHADQLLAATVSVLTSLHHHVLGPVADRISPDLPVTVSADGPLAAVPFAALHDGEHFVVERHSVRQSSSLFVDAIARERSRSRRSLLAVGAADHRAPLAEDEAQRAAREWTLGTSRIGTDAVASALVDEAPSYDVIHIAAHGLYRSDAPDFSAVRFADRWLTAAEIAHLELDGQLVVLSACDSGRRGLGTGTRELLGLPRSFLAAGASGVVAHLWPAHDRATTELMSTFHQSLAAGHSPSEALRAAQLHTKNAYPHPYHWGGAVLICGAETDTSNRRPGGVMT